MSRPLTQCLVALRPCRALRTALATTARFLSTTRAQRNDEALPPAGPQPTATGDRPVPMRRELLADGFASAGPAAQQRPPRDTSAQRAVMRAFGSGSSIDTGVLSGDLFGAARPRTAVQQEPHHMHVFAHKHNTYITVTRPSHEIIMSVSCGNVGYKKSRRGEYDAAYSLTKYALQRLVDARVIIDRLELVLRGFGPGREAAIKVLMTTEGKPFRDKIVRVADATRLKIGGTRSKRPRRL